MRRFVQPTSKKLHLPQAIPDIIFPSRLGAFLLVFLSMASVCVVF
jgi:hypothetical protein